jgi:hypothetical protein
MDVSRKEHATPCTRGAVQLRNSWVMTASTATAVRANHGEGSRDEFHRRSVAALHAAGVPFLIGGAYMVEVRGGVSRSTKDFDLYIRPNHVKAALRALARAGYKTELTFPHWLAKGTYEGDMLDLIFRAGNGLCEVDDSWFERASDAELLGVPVKHCAPEEMIWMKAYIFAAAQKRSIGLTWFAVSVLIGAYCSAICSCWVTFIPGNARESRRRSWRI